MCEEDCSTFLVLLEGILLDFEDYFSETSSSCGSREFSCVALGRLRLGMRTDFMDSANRSVNGVISYDYLHV